MRSVEISALLGDGTLVPGLGRRSCRRAGATRPNFHALRSIDCPTQAVLGGVENVLVWMEEASRLGYSPKRRELAWNRVSFVLDMDLKIQTSRRAKACQQVENHCVCAGLGC